MMFVSGRCVLRIRYRHRYRCGVRVSTWGMENPPEKRKVGKLQDDGSACLTVMSDAIRRAERGFEAARGPAGITFQGARAWSLEWKPCGYR